MADTFALEVLTPERTILRSAAQSVVLRTTVGGLTILDGHAALIAEVVPCEVRVQEEGSEPMRLALHGGFLHIDTSPGAAQVPELEDLGIAPGPVPGLSTRVTLLAGIAERADEIDVERARQAKEAAQVALTATGHPQREGEDPEEGTEHAWVAAELARAQLRLEVAGATS